MGLRRDNPLGQTVSIATHWPTGFFVSFFQELCADPSLRGDSSLSSPSPNSSALIQVKFLTDPLLYCGTSFPVTGCTSSVEGCSEQKGHHNYSEESTARTCNLEPLNQRFYCSFWTFATSFHFRNLLPHIDLCLQMRF